LRECGRWAVPLIAFLLCYGSTATGAPIIQLAIDVGFDGYLVPRTWTPLRIDVTAQTAVDGVLVVDVAEAGGVRRAYRYPVRLVEGARQQVHADVVIPDPRYPLTVRVLQGEDELGRKTLPLGGARAVDGVVVVLARSASGLEFLTTFSGRLRPAYIREEALPVRWQSYEGVSAVVIHDLDDNRLLPTQREALREWLAQGGRLLVTGGDFLATVKSRWLLDLLPGVPLGVSASQILPGFAGLTGPLNLALVRPRPGAKVEPDPGRPHTLQWRYGRGTVILWTFDAFAPQLRTSADVIAKWRATLTDPIGSSSANRSLAELLPNVPDLPGTVQVGIALAVGAYIVALRWALRIATRRRGWLTGATIGVVVGALLYGTAVGARESVAVLAQVSLVEVIPEVELARVSTAVVLHAPFGGPFHLVAPPQATIRPLTGPTVNRFGAAAEVEGRTAFPSAERFELVQVVPFAVRGTIGPTPRGLQVEIENASGLLIRQPVIYFAGQIYPVPDIQTHAAVVLDPTRWEAIDRQRTLGEDLASRLRQWTFVRLGHDVIIRPDQTVLIGWVDDARLAVRSPQAQRGSTASLLVVPLAAR